MPRIFVSNAELPTLPKVIRSKADALQALNRYVVCVERGEYAGHRGTNNGASITGDRYRETAARWQDKADAALDMLRGWLGEA